MKPEIHVLGITTNFEILPKGTLHITIGSKSESGMTEIVAQLSFDGTVAKPGLKTVCQDARPEH